MTRTTAIALGTVGLLVACRLGLDFNGLFGQDSHEYLRYATRWASWLSGGPPPGDYFWPLVYPVAGALLGAGIGSITIALQLLSMLAVGVTALYTRRLAVYLYPDLDRRALDLFGVLGVVFSPLMVLAGLSVMSDALATALGIATLYHSLRFYREGQTPEGVLAVGLGAAAVMTRYAMIVLVAAPLLGALWRQRRQWRRPGMWVPALLLVLLACLPHLLVRGVAVDEVLNHPALQSWSPLNGFRRAFVTVDGAAHYRFPNGLYGLGMAWHPSLLAPGALLGCFWRPRDLRSDPSRLLAAGLVLYGVFLAGIPYQNLRFLVPALPVAVVLLAPAWGRLWGRLEGRLFATVALTALLVLVQTGLFWKYSASAREANRLEQQVATRLWEYPPVRLYTFWLNGALASYGVPQAVVSLADSMAEPGREAALVLFNPDAFAEQWRGSRLMRNWTRLQSAHSLTLLERFSGGWALYRLARIGQPDSSDVNPGPNE